MNKLDPNKIYIADKDGQPKEIPPQNVPLHNINDLLKSDSLSFSEFKSYIDEKFQEVNNKFQEVKSKPSFGKYVLIVLGIIFAFFIGYHLYKQSKITSEFRDERKEYKKDFDSSNAALNDKLYDLNTIVQLYNNEIIKTIEESKINESKITNISNSLNQIKNNSNANQYKINNASEKELDDFFSSYPIH